MRSVAIMQPYLFPYVGYFQLVNAVDIFVIFDDVQYIKGGWINRNRILEDQREGYLTFPVKKDSTFLNINERYFSPLTPQAEKKIIKRLTQTYEKAPYFSPTLELVVKSMRFHSGNVAQVICRSLKLIQQYLDAPLNFVYSSDLQESKEFKGAERVIRISRLLGADHYINAIGGQNLYSNEVFAENGIRLSFLQTGEIRYRQFSRSFAPNLSIIDVLMFNSVTDVRQMLNNISLI